MEVSYNSISISSTPIISQNAKVAHLEDYRKAYSKTGSQRQAVKELNLPRGTVRYWLQREDTVDIEFFKSPAGISFLHGIRVAAFFCFNQLADSSTRHIEEFFNRSGLSKYIASSHGSVHASTGLMEQLIVDFGQKEEKRLGAKMPHKNISFALDESFYKNKPCLVGMEPVSNYILLEEYSDTRTASAWHDSIKVAIKDYNISLFQSVGDEGRGIGKCVKGHLGLWHSTDLFHVQYEITKGTAGPLNAKVRQADEKFKAAQEKLASSASRRKVQKSNKKAVETGCLNDSEHQVKAIQKAHQSAEIEYNRCKRNQEKVSEAKKNLGELYHPVDIDSGVLNDDESMREKLESNFSTIRQAAKDAALSEKCFARIDKANRLVNSMAASIMFFWKRVGCVLEEHSLDNSAKYLLNTFLIPLVYLKLIINKTSNKATKAKIQSQINDYESTLMRTSLWWELSEQEQVRFEKIAKSCAEIFQRSSSCVEGRNGQITLHYRNFHHLSKRKLAALTVLHNFHIKRSDGSTAAERFFDNKHEDLFEFLLHNMPCHASPAKKRNRLLQAA